MESHEVVLSLLSLAFGLWAGVVAWGVRRISTQLDNIGKDLKIESEKLNSYIVQTETRLAVLESVNKVGVKDGKR